MMYRSGCAEEKEQEHILAIKIKREGFNRLWKMPVYLFLKSIFIKLMKIKKGN